jgi:hypothetical protein
MRAPFAYFGGKSRLADRIAALFPPHHVYLEPGYHDDLYNDLYDDWTTIEWDVYVATPNRLGIQRRATEVIWTNRPIKHRQAALFA